MDDKILLTPEGYIPGPVYQLLDEQPDPRWITFECPLNDGARRRFTMTLQEIANILQVKALIEALLEAEYQEDDCDVPNLVCPLCFFNSPNHSDICKIGNALAPFKKENK